MWRGSEDGDPSSKRVSGERRHMATKNWSYTPRRTLKYRTFVDIAEIGTVSVLSSNQNEAYIGCRLKPETLT